MLYLLEHSYREELAPEYFETKFLGVFETRKDIDEAIDFYKELEGFRDYPIESFVVKEMELDKCYYTEGF